MITIWFLTVTLNGLLFATVEPMNSEEACVLTAKTAGIPENQFTCVSREFPDYGDQLK